MNMIKQAAASLLAAAITAMSGTAVAAVSEAEAAKLGAALTEFGAEKNANADGSIPAYTGGMDPAYAPAGWKKGSGRYEMAPWDNEKPLLSIDTKNVDQHAAKLTAGTAALLKKYPAMRVDVYPTHRSVGYTDKWQSTCKSNATKVRLIASGNGIEGPYYGCVPFPIPQNGLEVMWNHAYRNQWGPFIEQDFSNWLVDSAGHVTDIGRVKMEVVHPALDPNKSALDNEFVDKRKGTFKGPPSQVGTVIMQHYAMNLDKQDLMSWFYSQGQRRVRVAPEFSYDTPIASYGGAITYDEQFGFIGKPDRFDWKLVGKKEMYVPYNNNKLMFAPTAKSIAKGYLNPDVVRWEKHRVWVIESTLKPGKRHVYSRRTFYVDEDSWGIVASDSYDQGGKLYRVGLFPMIQLWDAQAFAGGQNFYDLSKGSFMIGPVFSEPGNYLKVGNTLPSASLFAPDSMAGRGVR